MILLLLDLLGADKAPWGVQLELLPLTVPSPGGSSNPRRLPPQAFPWWLASFLGQVVALHVQVLACARSSRLCPPVPLRLV